MDTNDTLLLILSELKDLKQGQQEMKQDIKEIKQHLEKHDGQLAAIAEAVNISNSELNSKIATVDKKVNVTACDILELRAAK